MKKLVNISLVFLFAIISTYSYCDVIFNKDIPPFPTHNLNNPLGINDIPFLENATSNSFIDTETDGTKVYSIPSDLSILQNGGSTHSNNNRDKSINIIC